MFRKDEKKSISQQTRAFPVEAELNRRKEFSDREVGLTHPDLSSFIRLNDQGDIEIFAAPGLGIVISTRSKSISFFADNIKMFTKEDGLRWNNYNFNYSASTYSEPTLVKINKNNIHSAINGIHHFLADIASFDEQEQKNPVTINPEYIFSKTPDLPEQTLSAFDNYEGLSQEQVALVEAYSSSYSQNHMSLLIKYLKDGYEFSQAHQKALKEINE